ncbi:hypothetical protein GCM10018955_35340 [Planomonospora venezuelensis]
MCTVSIEVPVYSSGWLTRSHATVFRTVAPAASATSNLGSHASIGALVTASVFLRVRSLSVASGPASGNSIRGWLRTTSRTVEPTILASTCEPSGVIEPSTFGSPDRSTST